MNHKLTNQIYPTRIETMQLPVTTNQVVQPLGWEWIGQIYALTPLIALCFVGLLIYKVEVAILKPEIIKEVVPVVKEIAIAKALPK